VKQKREIAINIKWLKINSWRERAMKENQDGSVTFGETDEDEAAGPIEEGIIIYGVNDGLPPMGVCFGVNETDPEAWANAELAREQYNYDHAYKPGDFGYIPYEAPPPNLGKGETY
jgi:CTP synthase (UTP-ammonia lyase)